MGFLSNLFGTGPQKTQMQTKLPEEIAPYVKDVLTDTQKLYQQRMGEVVLKDLTMTSLEDFKVIMVV